MGYPFKCKGKIKPCPLTSVRVKNHPKVAGINTAYKKSSVRIKTFLTNSLTE